MEHNMDVVMTMSDWVICLAEGRGDRGGPSRGGGEQPGGDRCLPRPRVAGRSCRRPASRLQNVFASPRHPRPHLFAAVRAGPGVPLCSSTQAKVVTARPPGLTVESGSIRLSCQRLRMALYLPPEQGVRDGAIRTGASGQGRAQHHRTVRRVPRRQGRGGVVRGGAMAEREAVLPRLRERALRGRGEPQADALSVQGLSPVFLGAQGARLCSPASWAARSGRSRST